MFGGTTGSDPAAMIGRIGRHWGWVLAFGVLTVLAGIAALVWPSITLVAAAVVFGVQLVIAGIYRLAAALASDDLTGGTRVLLAVLGVLSLVIGLYAVRHVLITIVALALLIGIFWVVNGVIETFIALSHRQMSGRGWRGFMGILSILAGIAVLAIPGISLVVLVVLLSVWLLLFGMLEISFALRMRSVRQAMASAAGEAHIVS